MSYAHNSLPDVTQTFQNTTLVKNWYEDRFQSDEAKATGKFNLTSAERTIPTLPGHEPQLLTTKQASDIAVMTVPPPAKVQKPSMYSAANIEERLQTYGVAPPLTYTIGRALLPAPQPTAHVWPYTGAYRNTYLSLTRHRSALQVALLSVSVQTWPCNIVHHGAAPLHAPHHNTNLLPRLLTQAHYKLDC